MFAFGAAQMALGAEHGDSASASETPPTVSVPWDQHHVPVVGRLHEVVGWADETELQLEVALPKDFEAMTGNSAIGVNRVYDSLGNVVGFIGPAGFVIGGVTKDGQSVTPEAQASLIEWAVANWGNDSTIPPSDPGVQTDQ